MAAESRPTFVQFMAAERTFLIVLMACFMLAAMTYQTPSVAMWVGFSFAGYSAVANDSIQTLGAFIASNKDQKWWFLWLYIGGIFIVTMVGGWIVYDGDITYQRLTSKGFDIAPESFTFLQVAAPLFLLVLTRLRMPVSTSILLLSCFATAPKGISSVIAKSVGGYGIAFVASVLIWMTLGRWMQRRFTGPVHPGWRVFQYITTGGLWAVWLAQDAANIAVYLPRQLSLGQMIGFVATIFFGLGVLFFQRGEKIQSVVEEKSAVADVRPASIIGLVYGLILWWKVTSSPVPMSTTWVFIGLLGGRELALTWTKAIPGRTVKGALAMMTRDLLTVMTGLLISLGLAVVINPIIRHSWLPSSMSIEDSACAHLQSGELESATATSAIDDLDAEAEYIIEPHNQYAVDLAGLGEAWLAFETDGGAVSLLLSDDVELALFDEDGDSVDVTDNGSSDICAPVDAWFEATLATGRYRIRLGGAEGTIGLLIED
jgi:hypothetical protein